MQESREMRSGPVLLVPAASLATGSEGSSRQASELSHSPCFLLWHQSLQEDRSSLKLILEIGEMASSPDLMLMVQKHLDPNI